MSGPVVANEELVQLVAGAEDFLGVDVDVGRLPPENPPSAGD